MTFEAANYRVQVTLGQIPAIEKPRHVVPNPLKLLAVYASAAVLGALIFLVAAAAMAYPDTSFRVLAFLSGIAAGALAVAARKIVRRMTLPSRLQLGD